MDTQNTPVHIHLWHRDFWFFSIAAMLIAMAEAAQVVDIVRMAKVSGLDNMTLGYAAAAFAAGMLIVGWFTSYLIQRFRRTRVCIMAAFLFLACLAVPQMAGWGSGANVGQVLMAVRLASGACAGLAVVVIVSTLIIDTCEPNQRTEANYAVGWFIRFALALGPFVALMAMQWKGAKAIGWTAAAEVAVALVLLAATNLPFRTPSDNISLLSADRFIMPRSWMLASNLIVVVAAVGMVLAVQIQNPKFFTSMMVGFMLAVVAEKFVFVNAELVSEAVAGMMLIIFALLIMLTNTGLSSFLPPLLIGLGIGLVGSRFLLFFIKLSDHCQRGTSQSSYYVTWMVGLALGLLIGFSLVGTDGCLGCASDVMKISLAMVVVAMAAYVAVTHRWYVKHKNR